MDLLHTYQSPLGEITLASDGSHIVGLWFEEGRYFGESLSKETTVGETVPVFQEAKRWLDLYFSGKDPGITPPLKVRGSAFRKRICEIMAQIPYGKVRTYGDIARQVAKEKGLAKMSAQAVGGAVGHNPISLMIPCHRVVGTSGSLTGYGGGMWRKVKLLQLEKTDMTGLFVPTKGTAL